MSANSLMRFLVFFIGGMTTGLVATAASPVAAIGPALVIFGYAVDQIVNAIEAARPNQ